MKANGPSSRAMKIFGRQIFSRIFANGIASNRSSMPKETPVSRCSLSSDCFSWRHFS